MKPHYRTLFILAFVYLALLLSTSATAPLIETTEARYAEIAREMMVSGNFLEPHLNGIKHFHKPPLTYWLVAAGMKLFGHNDFGARFFGLLAAMVAILVLYRMARLILQDDSKAFYAALIFATSWLFLGITHLVSTEIYLTCFVILAQYYLFRQIYGTRSKRNALLYGVFLGLGFLTKGPIVFLFTLLPSLIAKIFDREHRRIFTVGEILLGCAAFTSLALPWYVLVMAKNPGLLHYFLKVQTVDRVVTDRFHRYQPPWYFLAIFTGTFLPYVLFFLKGLRHHQTMPRRLKVLLIYVVAPLIVFSLSKGKHATYIAPFYGVAALWTAEVYARLAMPRLRSATLLLLAILAIAPAVASIVIRPLSLPWQVLAACMSLPLAWLAWRAFRDRTSQQFLFWTACSLLIAGCLGYAVFGQKAHYRRGFELLTGHINALDPERRLPVLVYRGNLPSVSFYRGHLAIMAMGGEREIAFEKDAAFRDYYLTSDTEIDAFLANTPQLFIVARTEDLHRLATRQNLSCETVYTHRMKNAYLCR